MRLRKLTTFRTRHRSHLYQTSLSPQIESRGTTVCGRSSKQITIKTHKKISLTFSLEMMICPNKDKSSTKWLWSTIRDSRNGMRSMTLWLSIDCWMLSIKRRLRRIELTMKNKQRLNSKHLWGSVPFRCIINLWGGWRCRSNSSPSSKACAVTGASQTQAGWSKPFNWCANSPTKTQSRQPNHEADHGRSSMWTIVKRARPPTHSACLWARRLKTSSNFSSDWR